jgi:acetyl esterase/lipase
MRVKPLLAAIALLLGVSAVGGIPAAAQEVEQEPLAVATVIQDVPYGPNARHNLDIYPAAASAPIVITVPGGGWIREDNSGTAITEVSRRLSELGYAVFSINYRVATRTVDGVPMMHQDIIRATQWVAAHGAEYGGDPADINLLGGSSGAQLTALAGQVANAQTRGLVEGVIEMSGVMNWFAFRDVGVSGEHQGAETYLGCLLEQCTDRELTAPSPELRVTPASPRHLLIHGAAETLPPSQASDMHDTLRAAGVPSRLILVPSKEHGLRLFPYTEDEIVAFLDS